MKTRLALAIATLLLSTGCGAIDRVNDALYETGAFDVAPSSAAAVAKDCGVTIVAGPRSGRGVISGADTVLTVAHVAGDATEVEVATGLRYTRGRVVRRIHSTPEDLVEIRVVTEEPGVFNFSGFDAERVATLAPGRPAFVLAATGIHGWARGLRHGDSGSPVIDAQGTVVGLLVGTTAQGTAGVMAPVRSSSSPSTVEPLELTRLSARR